MTEINRAAAAQMEKVSHVMFGGLTHPPAVRLAERLVAITPEGLDLVFFADSGSVSVEVAMKMAIQYWHAKQQPKKQKFLTIRYGYHGDTFGAMAVGDRSVFTEAFEELLFDVTRLPWPATHWCSDKMTCSWL